MSERLTWDEIKALYPEQWVELVEFDWDEFEPKPSSGIVRRSAKDRKVIHALFMDDPIENSAIVFTGQMRLESGTLFSANLHQYSSPK